MGSTGCFKKYHFLKEIIPMRLHVIKIGGNIIDHEEILHAFIQNISSLKEPFMLIHGGGKIATSLGNKMGIESRMVDGRRITDEASLDLIVMVYAGLINKKIVALFQSHQKNAIGLTGADANLIPATKRHHPEIDFGFVGDLRPEEINRKFIIELIEKQITLVIAPVTHNGKGQLLNTNADTIASSLAIALSEDFEVFLHFCFEKKGVLMDIEDEDSLIPEINKAYFSELKNKRMVSDGMIPKLENAFDAISKGVKQVSILHALNLRSFIEEENNDGTRIKN